MRARRARLAPRLGRAAALGGLALALAALALERLGGGRRLRIGLVLGAVHLGARLAPLGGGRLLLLGGGRLRRLGLEQRARVAGQPEVRRVRQAAVELELEPAQLVQPLDHLGWG